MIATALKDNDYRTRLTDTSWANVKTSRMEGLDTYYGNAVSEHADRHLDLIGLGQVLTLTPQKELNALAGLRYRSEFGGNHIFFLATESDEKDSGSRKGISHNAKVLFGNTISYAKLASLISQGASVKQTTLSDNFDYDDYQKQYGNRALPLFAFDSKKRLHFFTSTHTIVPEEAWTIVALIQAEKDEIAA